MSQAAQIGHKSSRLIAHPPTGATGTYEQSDLDDLARLAATLCKSPMAAISILDEEFVHYAATVGFASPPITRNQSLCHYTTLLANGPLVLSDVHKDTRFRNNPLNRSNVKVRSYVGISLRDRVEEAPIGTLSVMSDQVLQLSAPQLDSLATLARQVERLLQGRPQATHLARQEVSSTSSQVNPASSPASDPVSNPASGPTDTAQEHVAHRSTPATPSPSDFEKLSAEYELVFQALPFAAITADANRTITRINPAFEKMFGYKAHELVGRNTRILYAHKEDFNAQGKNRFNSSAPLRLEPFEIEFCRKNGETFISECVGTRVVDNGVDAGNVALIQDVSERVAARNELERLNEDRRAMLELLGSTDGVWSWCVGTDECDFAPGFRKILGFDGEDFQSFPQSWKSLLSRIHPADLEEFQEKTRLCLDQQLAFAHEFRLKNAKGDYFWVRGRANATRNPEGVPNRFVGTIHDITEIKNAEREREAFFNAGIQHYGVADMKTATWSRASNNWPEVLGYTAEELTGSNYLDMAHPDDRPLYIENMQTLSDGKPLVGFRGRLRHKNGSYKWIEFNVAPPEDDRLHVYFTARDVTNADHEMLHRIAAAVPMTLYVLSVQDMRIEFLSRQISNLLGYSIAETLKIQEDSPFSLTHPADRQRQQLFLQDICNGSDEDLHDLQLRLKAKSGEYRQVYTTARVNQRTPDGKVEQIVGTATLVDQITILRKYAFELENANEDLEQFAYIASHDLKQPLRGIDNLAKWIEEDSGDALPDVARSHLGRLKGRVSRMERLLDDLLDYSRIGRISTMAEIVDSAQLMEVVIDIVAAPETFQIEWSGPAISIETERIALEHVLRNLVGNAVKHRARDDGKVVVSAKPAGKFYEFSVRDNGPGIAPEFHERIFRMFQTLRPRDEVEASGMGLALSKKHVELRGGKITVESILGSGTNFRFTWPCSVATETSNSHSDLSDLS